MTSWSGAISLLPNAGLRPARKMRRLARLATVVLATLIPFSSSAETPELIQGVFERAQADVAAERYGRAYSRLQWLLFNDTDNAKRAKLYQTALHRIKQKQPLSFGAYAALMPSSNISKTFDGDASLVSASGDARRGIGLRYGAFAQATEGYAPGREIIARLDLGRSVYDLGGSDINDRRLNSQTTNFSLAHKWLSAGATYTVTSFSNRTWFQRVDATETSDVDSKGLSATLERRLKNGHDISALARIETVNYLNSIYLDGQKIKLFGSYSIPLSLAKTLTVSGGLERADLTEARYSYQGATMGLRYLQRMRTGLKWGIGATYTLREYNGLSAQLTGPSVLRADRVTDFSVSLSHQKIKIGDTIPQLNCSSRHNGSNVFRYDYNSIDCSMTFRLDF